MFILKVWELLSVFDQMVALRKMRVYDLDVNYVMNTCTESFE